MGQILGEEALQFTTIYVDDLFITSNTWEEHCQRAEYVLRKLEMNTITLKLNKSKLLTNQPNFLGFILTQGICASQGKVEGIRNFPTPKNLKQLQSFFRSL